MIKHKLRQICFIAGCLSFFVISPSYAEDINSSPTISIIIDDIGYRIHEDTSAIALPGPVAYAIMPHSPHAVTMSRLASQQGKIVLLHLPMEAEHKEQNQFLGPGALTLNMNREQFTHTLNMNLRSIPDAIGVNNHTGSKFTTDAKAMALFMESIKGLDLYFIDSKTSTSSRGLEVARRMQVPTVPRDLFLDNNPSKSSIRARFAELIRISVQHGTAVGICHFRPNTAAVLEELLPQIREQGIEIVHVSKLLP